MYTAYCMWRFAGTDPALFLAPGGETAEERANAMRVACALHAGSMESAITDLGTAFLGGQA